ncbi:hypothetical protein O181_036010 [Austropuccinia psidii MF-1]|uniref:DUF659 domain-containing protein n=1 Tax=Austropuccinia psidii MF-1 TaxID=1389203 RepID=A0A9Q3D827_9BASI|nr:hypothetical protein [Austropuccinia psidii MF-1]
MHIKDNCHKIPPNKKSKYIQDVLQNSKVSDSDGILALGTSTSLSTPPSTPSRATFNQLPSKTPSTIFHFQCLSHEHTQDLHEHILKALVISNVSFLFLDNHYFQYYQQALVQLPYKLPTRDSICNNALPLLHANIKAQIMQKVINSKGMTLLIDGWTDISGYSLYALLLL